MVVNLGCDNQMYQPQRYLDIQIPDPQRLTQKSFPDRNSKFSIPFIPLQLKLGRATSVFHEFISVLV